MRTHAPNRHRNAAALKKSTSRSDARIAPATLLALVAALLSLCAACTAADASSAVCSPNVSWYFAQPIAAATPAAGTLCSLPNYYTFTLAAPAAVTVQVTSSSGAPSNASDALLTHEVLGADFAPIAPKALPVSGAQTYTLDAGTYGLRIAGLSFTTAVYSALPYTLTLSEAPVTGDCAVAADDTATAPITTFPAQLAGALCPSGDTDTFGFYIDHPARLTFASSSGVQVLANDSVSGGAVILGSGEGAAPTTVLFQPGNHLLVVSSPPLAFFSGNYTISIAEDTSVAIPAECNRTDSLRTSVTLPFETSFTQCSYSDRAEFRFNLASAKVITIQFVDSAPGIAALRTDSGQLVAYAFRSGEVSQDFYLPAGNYTLQVPAWSDGQALPIDPIAEPQNGTLRITAASAACAAGALQAGAASSDELPTVSAGQPVTLCANATDLIAGAPTSVWFALDSAGDATFTAINLDSASIVTSAVAYDITGSGYPLPAVLPAGRYRVELGLARSQPFVTLNVTQTAVNTAGTTVQLPATIAGATDGIFPNVYYFSLPTASRLSINSQLVQDTTETATAVDLVPRPLVVRLFERCGWLDVCALYGNARVATEFYPGIFPTGKFQVNLPLGQDTTVDLASGEYGIEVSGFGPHQVNFSVTVSDASAVGCQLDASEPNDSPATATNFTLNSTVSATFCPSNDRDFYLLTLASAQRLTITYNGSVDSSLFVVNRLDASRLLQIASPSAATTVVLAEGVWLVLVAPSVAVANSTSPDAPSLAYTLTITAADEQCTVTAQSAVVSALPFAGNATHLCAAAADSANTSLTLSNASVVDVLVLSPSPLAWVLSNATGATVFASNKPKETLSLLPGTYTVAVFGSTFNTSQFQLFIVPSNASTAACLPDQYAANADRDNAAQVALPFIATLTSCGGSGDWFTFSTSFLSRLTITASRTADAFAAAAAGEASSAWSTDVCFELYQSNDTVPLFTSCGAASHTLPPATYALSVIGGAPFNLTVSAVPAVGVRQSGFATSLRVSVALVLVAASALLSLM